MPGSGDGGSGSREEIASAHAGGRLLAWLAGLVSDLPGSEREALFGLVARMHDAGEIDAVGALLDPGVEWDWTPEWLARQQVVAAVLPRLTAPVGRMTAAIDAVRGRMVQHVLDDAFLAWCEADLGRADEVIASVDRRTGIPDRFVLAALVAGLRTDPGRYLDISASMAVNRRAKLTPCRRAKLTPLEFVSRGRTRAVVRSPEARRGRDHISSAARWPWRCPGDCRAALPVTWHTGPAIPPTGQRHHASAGCGCDGRSGDAFGLQVCPLLVLPGSGLDARHRSWPSRRSAYAAWAGPNRDVTIPSG